MCVVQGSKYRLFFDLSRDMQCIASTAGNFIEINDAFSEVLSYSKSQLLNTPFLQLIHQDDLAKTQNALQSLARGESILNFINRYKHLDGFYLTFSWSAQVDPQSGLIYAVARNITEQRNLEYRYIQIEKMLDAETIFVETDKKGIIQRVNDNFCQISGYSRAELIGKTHKLVNSGYHPKEFFASMWRTIASNKVWSGVIKNRKKNGEFYYVKTFITPINDHEGNIVRYLAIRQDITASVKDGTELAKTLAMFKETSAIAKVGGWELDITTNELIWTDETFNIFEIEKNGNQNPMLPQGIKLFVEEHQPLIKEALERAIAHGEPFSMELEALSAKGNIHWVFITGKANYRDGKIASLSGIIQDIDERKKAEQEHNLERQKSIQSAKLASLGALAASMAHEINNPLSIIYGYTDLMLLDLDISKDLSEKLLIVNKSCERISHLVKNLKKFSRTETLASYSNQSISMIINDAISLTTPRLKQELVRIISVGKPPASAMIFCNPIEIEQVFINLINNSIDAIKDLADRWISISFIDRDDKIECYVTDSGSGICEAAREKIFAPFYTSKKIDEGTGLGLSIIRRILKSHNATICYSGHSENTCFVLTFNKVKEN